MIARYYIKSLLTNKSLLGWSIGFMFFWIVMGAYLLDGTSSFSTHNSSLEYTSGWFAFIGLIAGSVLSTSIAYSVYYANSSLIYSFKFTVLKPFNYLYNFVVSSAIVSLIIGAVLTALIIIVFSLRAGYLIYPVEVPETIGLFVLTGVFMLLLAVFFVIAANNYIGLKNISFVMLLPQLLSYLFGLSALDVGLPSYIVYGSPFTAILRLFLQAFYGRELPLNMVTLAGGNVNGYLLLGSMAIWVLALLGLDMILVKRIKYRSIEEARRV
ncbi:MAG: hypothetical protein M1323_04615 [Candidatus Thermoplasmatota archaeon]|jgi:hypothetical protein|nr:hypothetical protein [Candidatus Thermoplasmatota archaeon]